MGNGQNWAPICAMVKTCNYTIYSVWMCMVIHPFRFIFVIFYNYV
jgi:hypothetical protein